MVQNEKVIKIIDFVMPSSKIIITMHPYQENLLAHTSQVYLLLWAMLLLPRENNE